MYGGKFAPQGDYIRRGNLTEGFFCYDFGGLIFGRAYFRNFTVPSEIVFIIFKINFLENRNLGVFP